MLIRILLLSSILISANSHSDWQLNKALSELSFIATKDARVADNHYFTDIDANISDNGQVTLSINMASVETNITKRDKRLRALLFNVAEFPTAEAVLKVRRSYLKPQPAGTQKTVNVKGHLTMVGVNQPTAARLIMTHRSDGKVAVSTIEPILVDSEDFGMLPGIDALAKLAGLKTISIKIPVSFNLVFDDNGASI